MHMSITPLVFYEKLYLYLKTIDQDMCQHLSKKLENCANKSKFEGSDIYEYSSDAIQNAEFLDNKLQKILLSDYYICDNNQDKINKYLSKEVIIMVVLTYAYAIIKQAMAYAIEIDRL